jgi:hypothetical protein
MHSRIEEHPDLMAMRAHYAEVSVRPQLQAAEGLSLLTGQMGDRLWRQPVADRGRSPLGAPLLGCPPGGCAGSDHRLRLRYDRGADEGMTNSQLLLRAAQQVHQLAAVGDDHRGCGCHVPPAVGDARGQTAGHTARLTMADPVVAILRGVLIFHEEGPRWPVHPAGGPGRRGRGGSRDGPVAVPAAEWRRQRKGRR